jgi:hypothetical protein
MESKHGDIYKAFGDRFQWTTATNAWAAGTDFRGPTCAVCHMSHTETSGVSHNVSERLAWESQSPLSVRPSEFDPFPFRGSWKREREKMKSVCRPCHSSTWIDSHFRRYDRVIEEYNENYFRPAKKKMEELYKKGLLNNRRYFDESLEYEYFELWRHEGRRARMGAAMMAPDYSWWHGFYECKKRYAQIMEKADKLLEEGEKASPGKHFPKKLYQNQKPEIQSPFKTKDRR